MEKKTISGIEIVFKYFRFQIYFKILSHVIWKIDSIQKCYDWKNLRSDLNCTDELYRRIVQTNCTDELRKWKMYVKQSFLMYALNSVCMNHLQNRLRKKEYYWDRYIWEDLHLGIINKENIQLTMKII